MLQLKKIDRLLLTSFVGPFFVTFLIAIFVLMMQTLWVYVDDIIGKGAGFFMLIELVSYLVMSLVPMALPIAVLISSVMVLGNLGERYELSSMKSAGIPLLRVMMPLVFVAAGIALFSFYCSNSLIPISNLKFKSRLYDIRKQRPTLSIEEGLFNDDFQGYVIRVGKKGSDDKTIENVLVYDHTAANEDRLTEIIAKRGKMYSSDDEKYFVMELEDGSQYYEIQPSYNNGRQNYPFVRTSFKEWKKVFDLSAFEIQRTDEELFKTHHSMLSARQLAHAVDTIDAEYTAEKKSLSDITFRNFKIFEKKDTAKTQTRDLADPRRIEVQAGIGVSEILEQKITKELSAYQSILELYPTYKQVELLDKAKSFARTLQVQAESTLRSLDKTKEKRVKHVFELHSKFSLAVACFIFLFIGAPMGAIVRKGGFGYPILISIIFFMLFVTLTIMSKKLAEGYALPPVWAAWVSCLILFPIGLLLTWKAMNDSKLFNIGSWVGSIWNWLSKIKSKI